MANSIELYTHPLFSDANLVAYWRTEGNSNDAKGSNNGTDSNITYSSGNGKFGQGAGFNGTSSKIVLASEQTSTTGSFNCWFKVSGAGAYQIYSQSKSTGSDTDRILLFISGGKVCLGVSQSSSTVLDLSTNATFNDGNWHMATYVVGASSNAIYVDGSPQAVTYTVGNSSTSKWFGTISASTDTKDIGVLNILGSFFNWFSGAMDDISIFSRVLTSNEISSLYDYQVANFLVMF